MNILGFIGAWVLLMAAGFGLSSLLLKSRIPLYELAAVSWVLGGGYVSLALWITGFLVHGKLLLLLVAAGALALGILGLLSHRRSHPSHRVHSSITPLETILLICLTIQAGLVVALSFRGVFNWDAFMIWEAKARWAFLSGGVLPNSYFSDTTRLISQPYYPLLFPYLQTWFYLGMGEVNQSLIRMLCPLFYFASQALLVSGIQRMGGTRVVGLLTAALFPTIPYLFSSGWVIGNADFPMGTIYLAAMVFALSWLKSSRPEDLRLLAVVAALLPWMKREGKFLWLAVLLVPVLILCSQRKWRSLLTLVAPGIVLIGAWTAFLSSVHVQADPYYMPLTLENFRQNSERLFPILNRIINELTEWNHWSVWWPVAGACILTLTLGRNFKAAAVLVCALGLPLAVYSVVYLFSNWPGYLVHMELSVPRLLLQLMPSVMLTFGLIFPRKPADLESDAGVK